MPTDRKHPKYTRPLDVIGRVVKLSDRVTSTPSLHAEYTMTGTVVGLTAPNLIEVLYDESYDGIDVSVPRRSAAFLWRVRINDAPAPEQELVTAASYALACLLDPDASPNMCGLVAKRLDEALQTRFLTGGAIADNQEDFITAASYTLATLRDPDALPVARDLAIDRLDTALQMYYSNRTRVLQGSGNQRP